MKSSRADIRCDVLVVGAGPAGFGAALAARRNGCDVVLAERLARVGGTLTHGLALTPVGYEPFRHWLAATDPAGWLVQGIARELHDRLLRAGGVCKPVWDPEMYAWLVETMLAEAGVRLLLHAGCVDAVHEGDRVVGAVLALRSGLTTVRADICIDASGDGDLFARAGCAFEVGREADARPQPMTTASVFGNLRLDWGGATTYADMMAWGRDELAIRLTEGRAKGELPPIFVGNLFPYFAGGRIVRSQVWCRMVQSWRNPLDADDATLAEVEGRAQLQTIVAWMRTHLPGFEDAALIQSSMAWPRESRRLRGVATLRETDVAGNVRRDDGIARGACFLEVHSATPGDPEAERGYAWSAAKARFSEDVDYDIAYGCLVPERIDGLLVAGRCLSATHIAHGSARMQATAMALGQAAGTAAALAQQGRVEPRAVDVARLRDRLRHVGARV
ncbi:MAG: FAD-dependent oxidoreductase [Myxococcales bacterium]|nr:FAD-dependent oxidoreductase [Myxococcales bacterium]